MKHVKILAIINVDKSKEQQMKDKTQQLTLILASYIYQSI